MYSSSLALQLTSLRKKKPIMKPMTLRDPATPQGSQYGYFRRNSESPNKLGKPLTGSEREPPMVGPMIEPTAYMSGRKEKALA